MKRVAGALLLVMTGCAVQERPPVAVQVESFGESAVAQLRNLDEGGAGLAEQDSAALSLLASAAPTDPMSEAVQRMVRQLSVGLRELLAK